jgi:predicted nucleic acid-binding protein
LNAYVDTSVFVSLYLPDRHSLEAQRLVSQALVWLTPLHIAEWTHAIEQHVFRKTISGDEAAHLHNAFQTSIQRGVWLEVLVPDSALQRCAELARRYAAKFGLRTLDTLHVACALELNAGTFWTFDERQQKLAKACNLKTTI